MEHWTNKEKKKEKYTDIQAHKFNYATEIETEHTNSKKGYQQEIVIYEYEAQ